MNSESNPQYLRACFEQFKKVTQAKWGKPFNLPAIEKDVEPLRHQRELSYEQLNYFSNREHWWFQQWWAFPVKEGASEKLQGKKFDFWQLPRDGETSPKEIDVIRALFDAFKSIELVSIILRFIRPDSYGIMSPPTERLLNTRRGSSAVETYVNYISDLRRIRGQPYGLNRVADVDMALWVLHAKCFDEPLKDSLIQQQFEEDQFLRQLRAENLFDPLSGFSLTLLAQAIQHKQGHLAALVASHFFELELRALAKDRGVNLVDRDGKDLRLSGVIRELEKKGIDHLTIGKWNRLREIRNNLIHQGKVPISGKIESLVNEALELQKRTKGL